MAAAGAEPFALSRRGGLDVLTWPQFDGQGLEAIVTTRSGGLSEGPYATLNLGLHVGDDPERVVENRRRAAAAVGLGLADLVFCEQAHGREVVVVDQGHRGRGTESVGDAVQGTDALVTASPGIGLVVMVADCVPIVLFDPLARVLACIHAGWRGTVARVPDATLDVMGSLGAEAGRVLAGIGPAVPAARYQVGEEVTERARAGLGAIAEGAVRPDGKGRWLFDLWTANRRVLLEAGVPARNIALAAIGTGGGSPFFSDREARPCGRFAAIAALRP